MRFHAIQTSPVWEDPTPNRLEIEEALRRCSPLQGGFVVLPELCETGFTMRSDLAAQTDSVQWGSRVAREHGIWLQCGLARRQSNGRVANTATIFSPAGDEIGQYCKTFLFTPSGEDRTYCAGDGPRVFDCGGVRIAPMICYDLRFPELWRHALLGGAEVFTLGACWPAARLQQKHAMIASRAIENQAWVIAANRTGEEPTTHYCGGSSIVDSTGVTKAICGSGPGSIHHDVDIEALREFRKTFRVISDIQEKFLGSPIFRTAN
ncbi:MAG: hypothetical protein EXS15_05900 [Phycisphaerales bacterium]|nr:hypothetical protein [Phycisphaerales bacterium]